MSGIRNKCGNLYSRDGYGYNYLNANKIIKILIVHMMIFLFIILVFNATFKEIIVVIYFVLVLAEFLFLVGCYADGFKIDRIGIKYYRLFKPKKVLYKEIKSIVISHAVGRAASVGYLGKYERCSSGKMRFRPYPWVTLCDKVPDKVIKEFSYTLDSVTVDYLLGKNGMVYSFIWNKWAMENLMAEFDGDFYVTKSIAVRYKKELQEMAIKYEICEEKIHIVTDTVAIHFLWDNDL